MRLQAAVEFLLSEDVDQLYQLGKQKRFVDDTGVLTSKAVRIENLAINTNNQQVLFTPEVTNAKYVLVLVSTGEVRVRFNDLTGTLIPVKPLPAVVGNPASTYQKAEQPGRLFVGPTLLTALYLTNPSGTVTPDVTIVIVGEGA